MSELKGEPEPEEIDEIEVESIQCTTTPLYPATLVQQVWDSETQTYTDEPWDSEQYFCVVSSDFVLTGEPESVTVETLERKT